MAAGTRAQCPSLVAWEAWTRVKGRALRRLARTQQQGARRSHIMQRATIGLIWSAAAMVTMPVATGARFTAIWAHPTSGAT
jgi:hypothetical protein